MLARAVVLLAMVGGATASAVAHEVRPAFLQIREIEPATYDVLWKTPAQGDLRLALNVVLPRECRNLGEPRRTLVNAAVIEHWRSTCEGGLLERPIVFENLQATLTDVILRFEPLAGSPRTLRVDGAAPHAVIPERQTMGEIAWSYFRMGVEHILFGIDHLSFVLCLLMLIADFKRLIGAVTAFTLAHSITLAGTTFGWLHLASAPVEACIALSIAFLAAQIVKTREGGAGATQRWPWIASFAFGLLHGFGFAAALRDVGLPDEAVPLALLFFNIGVEAGQLLFIAAMLVWMSCWRRYAPLTPAWVCRTPAYMAGVMACFWFIERTLRIVL